MKADREVDFHGFTAMQMQQALEDIWAGRRWHGLRRVRVVHGTGTVLWRVLREWCDAKGIPWVPEPSNPGATVLHPSRRVLPPSLQRHRPLARLKHLRTTHQPCPASSSSPLGEPQDLMAEEFRHLAKLDAHTLLRRKHAG
jgi:hypothetical protein